MLTTRQLTVRIISRAIYQLADALVMLYSWSARETGLAVFFGFLTFLATLNLLDALHCWRNPEATWTRARSRIRKGK